MFFLLLAFLIFVFIFCFALACQLFFVLEFFFSLCYSWFCIGTIHCAFVPWFFMLFFLVCLLFCIYMFSLCVLFCIIFVCLYVFHNFWCFVCLLWFYLCKTDLQIANLWMKIWSEREFFLPFDLHFLSIFVKTFLHLHIFINRFFELRIVWKMNDHMHHTCKCL